MDGLIFLYLILFPFGKLTWYLPDILVAIIAIFSLSTIKLRLNKFVLICALSLVFSLSFFRLSQILTGILYLARFISYTILARIVQERFGKTNTKRTLIINSLILVGIFISIFGWIQYFLFPDLRILKIFGWDDHYFRLVSTFLDPAFTGILLVLTEILVVVKTIQKKTVNKYILNIFLIVTILFTYSRASYLALFFVLIFLFLKFKERFIFFLLFLFLILIPALPKESSEGTNLARTYSINQKFVSYNSSLELIKKSPVFGIGFNNALISSFVAVFIHGMFTETFFYSFILGWMAILIGVTRN